MHTVPKQSTHMSTHSTLRTHAAVVTESHFASTPKLATVTHPFSVY